MKDIAASTFLFIYIFDYVYCGVTMDQMNKSGQMLRNVCQPKTKVTDELIDSVRNGNFVDDKSIKCYVQCILELSNMMKKNKVNYAAAMKQFEILLPDELIEPYQKSLTICKDSGTGIKDACEVAYVMLKCIYENNPQFIFP